MFAPLRPLSTGAGAPRATSPLPRLRPNRSLATSPISSSFPRGPNPSTQAYQSPANGTMPSANVNVTSDPKADSPSTTDDSATADEEAEVHDSLIADTDNANYIPVETETNEEDEERRDVLSEPTPSSYPSNTGRPGIGTIPRTVPLYLNGNSARTPYKHHFSQSLGSISSSSSPPSSTPNSNLSKEAEDIPQYAEYTYNTFSGLGNPTTTTIPLGRSNTTSGVVMSSSPGSRSFGNISPLSQTATGTRYGIALDGGNIGVQMTGTGTPRKWGAGTPQCPRCAKSVYFAEQVRCTSYPILFYSIQPLNTNNLFFLLNNEMNHDCHLISTKMNVG